LKAGFQSLQDPALQADYSALARLVFRE
jgi:hypothetical protein